MLPDRNDLVFVGGVHRSGKTVLARALAQCAQVSLLHRSAAGKDDEGQHLQTVYPSARAHGGAGRFALDERAHLTETSSLATTANAHKLLSEWRPYWDVSRRYLVETSPPNVLMTRYLQELYPHAYFVMVLRHPVAVAMATREWKRNLPVSVAMENWFRAYETLRSDASLLRRLRVVRYEDLVAAPDRTVRSVAAFLGATADGQAGTVGANANGPYFSLWRGYAASLLPWRRSLVQRMRSRYEPDLNRWGYSLTDLDYGGSVAQLQTST